MPRIEDGIIIRDPKVNDSPYRRFTSSAPLRGLEVFEEESREERDLSRFIAEGIIDAGRFPTAVDLFAGDGSWAKRLVDKGWDPKNVTCVDIARTETPLVDGVSWLYMDLVALAHTTNRGYLSGAVDQLRGRFDLALMSYGNGSTYGDHSVADILCGFFIRRGGIAYAEGNWMFKARKESLMPLR